MHLWVCFILVLVTVEYAESTNEIESAMERRMLPPRHRFPWIINNTAAGLYNSATEKCCLGSVHSNKKPAYDRCCGTGVFDSSKQLCCNDVIVPLVAGKICCGQKTLNTDSSFCCDGEEVKMEPGALSFTECCGRNAYDKRTQTCCMNGMDFIVLEGTNRQCCGNETYEFGKQVCCSTYKNNSITYRVLTIDGTKTSCCGDAVYDQRTNICCGDEVAPRPSSCCNGKAFNSLTHICCNQEVVETNGKNMGCCGNKVLDRDNELCCSGRMPDGSFPLTVVKKTDPKQTACCGNNPFDITKQLCCHLTTKVVIQSSADHNICCGDASFNSQNGLCCGDAFFENATRTTHQCCGGKLMDINANTCCANKILEKSKSCCGDSANAETYDAETQLCCLGYNMTSRSPTCNLVSNPNGKLRCCSSGSYDSEKELCCWQKAVPKIGNGQCCGGQSYDVDKEVCCSETTVLPKEDGRDTCCFYGTTDAIHHYPSRFPPYIIRR